MFCQGITVDDKRIADINALADKLISQGRTDTNAVKEKRNNLNQKYVISGKSSINRCQFYLSVTF